MERALHDNALLQSCERIHSRLATGAVVALTGAGIGCFWYLLVCFRAGVL
jgi:hypothetical protein